ncbi:MAG TPA: endonuclease III, partial [Bacteroidota bacterium]
MRRPGARGADRPAKILGILRKKFPEARTALVHRTPFELLVATILSAQCTDDRVNRVTAELFKKYRTAGDFASLPQEVLQREIHSTGFFRSKAKSIIACSAALLERHGGN